MFIKKICKLDRETNEAEIIVSDGENEIRCCAWSYLPNQSNRFSLSAFMIKNIERSTQAEYYIKPNKYSYFSHDISGRLLNNGTVAVGKILIDIGIKDIPKDIMVNDYIKFSCLRVDFIQESGC